MVYMLVFLILVIALIAWFFANYNRLVTTKVRVDNAWSQIDIQLKRRHDLIPNLVDTVKGYATHEQAVFQAVADSRAKLAGATTPAETISAANAQSAALARLLAVVENYPQLKAIESFNRLMDELAGTENRIAVERMRYNERIQEYNTSRRQFPANITARMFSFKDYPFFDSPAEAQKVPTVNFSKPPTS